MDVESLGYDQQSMLCHPFSWASLQRQGQHFALSAFKSFTHLMSEMIPAPSVAKAFAQFFAVLSKSTAHYACIFSVHSSSWRVNVKFWEFSVCSKNAKDSARTTSTETAAIVEFFMITRKIIEILSNFITWQKKFIILTYNLQPLSNVPQTNAFSLFLNHQNMNTLSFKGIGCQFDIKSEILLNIFFPLRISSVESNPFDCFREERKKLIQITSIVIA